jgi:acetyl-CoA carboxylase biotin carboxylase subunit
VFERVLIANRGEVAVRIIRACRELGVETVAVYSTADRESLHVRLADRAVHIGPPLPADSYLRIPSLVAAATTTECDAVHPGWGFLAENPAFALACEDNDLVFIGPRAETIETMGDKVAAKEAMAEAGVPLVPGSEGAVDLDQAREVAADVGFPVLLKASAGGGGRGMRLVEAADELDAAFRTASSEAQSAFGDGSLYVEKAVVGARHVEIQVLGDGEGAVLTLGERDCSIQRRHQKLVEESPSPAVTPEIRAEMEGAAHRACEALRYRGAGTIEFLLDADGRFYFIEMNTRLQVEHPVTELVTGIDLAHVQLAVAAGDGLPRAGRADMRGHAIEFRINAEDPSEDFRPAPGRVLRFRPPLGPGVRVDTHVEEGYAIPPFYDSLIAKVIVWGEDREVAIARGRRALSELELKGIPTTRELALDIVSSEAFGSGDYTTSFLADAAPSLESLRGGAA